MTVNLSDQERHIMEHATGWNSRQPLYRNRYVTGPDADAWSTIQALCVRGLMRMSGLPSELSGDDYVFSVTNAGIERLREHV